jgi:hypothetical protein
MGDLLAWSERGRMSRQDAKNAKKGTDLTAEGAESDAEDAETKKNNQEERVHRFDLCGSFVIRHSSFVIPPGVLAADSFPMPSLTGWPGPGR